MRMEQIFKGSYLKAADFAGKGDVNVTIKGVALETLNDEDKAVMTVMGGTTEKKLVLNKTNARIIAKSFGDDTDLWIDKTISLYGDECFYSGRMVPCIRVKVPKTQPVQEAPQAAKSTVPQLIGAGPFDI